MKPQSKILIISIGFLVVFTILLTSRPISASLQSSATQPYATHIFQSTTTNSTTTTSTNVTAPWGIGFISTPFVAWVKGALTPIIGNPPTIPSSTLFTIGVALVMSLISSSAAKLLVDYDMVRSTMKEVQSWQKELNAARKARDEQTTAKLMKKQQAMMKQQSRASMEQMKVTAVTFVPFLVVWYTLNAVLGRGAVAFAPFPLPFMGTTLTFFYWYLLCSFSLNLPLMRVFGIGMSEN
jgi:uncharacterized membrane protein (DUF106 family)